MKKGERDYRLVILMGVVLVFGIFFVSLSYILTHNSTEPLNFGSQVLRDAGIALIIASFLGASIDQLLRKQLAEDAFKASIGYLLPEELRGELEWIYNCHVLCVEHTQTCELRPIDNETCAFHVKTIRKFRNISSSNESLPIGVSIDEWFNETSSSKILAFGYSKVGIRDEAFATVRGKHSIDVKEQKVSLLPAEEITAWHETEEILNRNSQQIWNFGSPTLNPTVTVKAFEGISIEVGFGYRSPAEELGIGTYRLKGTLLPSQIIVIRWWEKEKGEKWAKAVQKTNP